jgi:hypothetical protein
MNLKRKYKFKCIKTYFYTGNLIFVKDSVYTGYICESEENWIEFYGETDNFFLNIIDPNDVYYIFNIMVDLFKYGK